MKINTILRRYHRQIAICMCLPLTLTVITGVLYSIFNDWLSLKRIAGFMLQIHSGAIFKLEAVYPLFNGLGLAALLLTGLSMTSLFRKRT